jgi:S1-C subfamily serine protease
MQALSRDYCLLKTNAQNLFTLPVGNFSDIQEGDNIYLCGYPLGISQPVVARGMLSTKWLAPGYLNQGSSKDVAWLDVTMNRGNSGGPIILLSDQPENDKIIGIATFGLNPFAQPAEELIETAQSFPGSVGIMGIDFKKFSTLIGSALATTSLGVNGCVSIDYSKTVIP